MTSSTSSSSLPASCTKLRQYVSQLAATFQRFATDLLKASSSSSTACSSWSEVRAGRQQPIWTCLKEAQALHTAAEVVSSSQSVVALPEFGCAILVLSGHGSSCTAAGAAAAGSRLDEIPVYLVALDSWGFQLHG